MELHVGTSGFSYKEWKGSFYPEDLPAKRMLAFYAERLGSVEINNTFYRLPKASVLESWAEQVPETFRFVIKASRRITHFKRLKEAGDETAYLVETVGALGEKLGCLLFQLPPNLKLDLSRLDAFLCLLPANMPAAFEFRHPSWACAEVFERLRADDRAWVGVDSEDAPLEELVRTAGWGYLRLRGTDYADAAVADWAARIQEPDWQEAFVFFKHEDEGAAPRLATALAEQLAGAPQPPKVRPARRARARRETA
ncbi:MAG: DUF72 domain-containing protein [Myxococcota bacterium]